MLGLGYESPGDRWVPKLPGESPVGPCVPPPCPPGAKQWVPARTRLASEKPRWHLGHTEQCQAQPQTPRVTARPQGTPWVGGGCQGGGPVALPAALAPTVVGGQAGSWGGGQGGMLCPRPQHRARARAASAGRWGQRGLGEGHGHEGLWGTTLVAGVLWVLRTGRVAGSSHQHPLPTRWARAWACGHRARRHPWVPGHRQPGTPLAVPALPCPSPDAPAPSAASTPAVPARWEPGPGLGTWAGLRARPSASPQHQGGLCSCRAAAKASSSSCFRTEVDVSLSLL